MFNLIHTQNNLWYGKFSIFPETNLIHAISTRFNGYSNAPFKSLNLALHVNDEESIVQQNREKFCTGLDIEFSNMTTCQQVHGNKIILVDETNKGSGAFHFSDTICDADALITNKIGIALTLFFADCTPIMIYDPVQHAIGVAHGGWRGTVGQIAKKTVEAMQKAYNTNPQDCLASIGPAIGKCCYEIGNEVADQFKEVFAKDSQKILEYHQDKDKYHLDLWTANAIMLQRAGLSSTNIDMANTCTCCNHDIFFSYRADHGKTGRIACIMALK